MIQNKMEQINFVSFAYFVVNSKKGPRSCSLKNLGFWSTSILE